MKIGKLKEYSVGPLGMTPFNVYEVYTAKWGANTAAVTQLLVD